MKRVLASLALAAVFGSALAATAPSAAAAADDDALYLAPGGDDTASGTIDDPLATLEGARDRIRALKADSALPSEGLTVYLREGEYPRSSSFEIGAQDSGTADAPITYRSYPGETATLTGGRELPRDQFAPVDDATVTDRIIDTAARDRVVGIDLADLGITDYGQLSRHGYWKANDVSTTPPMELFIDGQGMTLARWPNADAATPTVQMGDIIDAGPDRNDADLQDRGGTFSYGYDRPKHWTQAEDVWLDGIFGYSWEWSYNKIESIDTDAKTITLRYGEMSGIMKSWFPDFHFAQNLLEELDAPGEYYIDRAAGKLYLIPNAAFTSGRGAVTVTTLDEPMLRADGASYVNFDDLVMEYGRATAAVILGGSHVTISHSDIRNFTDGGVLINSPGRYTYDGIPVNRGGRDHAVTDSRLTHVGGVGVVLQGGDKTTLEPGRNRVENSEIADFAYYHKAYNPGVMFDGVGNIARDNEIHDAPHPGIIVHGNDHLFERNEVYDVCKQFHDLGAIYMNSGKTPQQRGHVFRENYFHDIGVGMAGVEGIYADNFTWDLTIEKNVFVNMGNGAIKSGSADYIEARNNVFVDAYAPYDNYEQWMGNQEGNVVDRDYMPAWEQVFADNNDFVGTPYLTKYPELAHFFEDDHYFPNHSTFAENVVWNPNRARMAGVNEHGAKDGKNLLNYEDNWVADADPGFVDAANGDYTLKADAAVFDQIPGFEAIAFGEIGVDGEIGQTQQPQTVPLEDIAFDTDTLTIDAGDEVRVRAVPLPWNADDAAVTYASADAAVATVNDKGVVLGMGPGTTTVTATAKADATKTATIEVIVEEGDGVLHFTDFESGANGWPTDPNRSIQVDASGDKVYRIVKGANSLLPRDFTEFVLDFDVTAPATTPANAGLIVYDRNGKGGGYIRFRQAAAGPTWTIFDDAWKVVAEKVVPAAQGLTPGETSHVRIAVQDGQIRISVNGAIALEGADPGPAKAGRVGFYVENYASLDFDDIGFSLSGVPVTGVSLDADAIGLTVGERRSVAATIAPEDASDARVTWTTDAPEVATVSGGRIAGVAAGTATITATSVADPSLSDTITVTVDDAEYPTTRLDGQLKDGANWSQSDHIAVDDTGVVISGEGVHGYEAERFGDTLLQFDAEFGAFDGGWYGFQARSDQTGLPAWQNSNTGYLAVIKEDVIEFQSWTPGQTMLDSIPNTVIEPGSTHRIEFGAVAEDGGTRIVLRVDDVTVWNMVDARENLRIGADGFFNVYHYGKTNTLAVRPTPPPATVTGICWAPEADPKTRYVRGEELDVAGMLLGVDWSDGSRTTQQVTADMVSGFDSSKVRPHHTLTVTYAGASVELPISVRPKLKNDEQDVPRCG
ncbi:Ig-like domain-containing protein [Microbacterium algeriense]|uniref:Ig-like domain-containing protein n=1 Tax=Microbacterium algeriense TaxID=2615184 RepID=UPI0029BEBCF5|nr:Ig-like domain-containing protein [Microbacterium algeriense]MDX2400384.1 Ig-like domain-containing protein [Microbacterium algeriense]